MSRARPSLVALLLAAAAGCDRGGNRGEPGSGPGAGAAVPAGGAGAATVQAEVDPERRAQAEAVHRHALELMRARDPQGAVLELRRAVTLDPTLTEAWVLLGRHCLHLSSVVFGVPTRDLQVLEEAVAAFSKASELEPASAEYAYLAGYAAARLEDAPQASAYLRKAIELDPTRGAAFDELGLLQAKAGDIPAAKHSLQRATELLPDSPTVWFHYGQQLEAEEEFEGARAAYQTAIRLDWTLPATYSKLAPVLRRLGDAAGAEQAARDYERWNDWGEQFRLVHEAAKADPEEPAKALAVARKYLEAERLRDTLFWIDIALAADPRFLEGLDFLRDVAARHPESEPAQALGRKYGARRGQ